MIECIALNPVEIIHAWDALFNAVRLSNMYQDDAIAKMLNEGAQGRVQVWILKRRHEDQSLSLNGVLITQMYYLPYTKTKTLSIIHGNAVVDHIDDTDWQRVYKTLVRYARDQKCNRIEIFSDNPRVQEIITAIGFKPSGHYAKEVLYG